MRKIKCLGSYNGHQSGNIYSAEGLSPALCSTDYKAPIKIAEMGGELLDNRKIKFITENFSKVDENTFVTTERERECLCCYNSPTQQTFV